MRLHAGLLILSKSHVPQFGQLLPRFILTKILLNAIKLLQNYKLYLVKIKVLKISFTVSKIRPNVF